MCINGTSIKIKLIAYVLGLVSDSWVHFGPSSVQWLVAFWFTGCLVVICQLNICWLFYIMVTFLWLCIHLPSTISLFLLVLLLFLLGLFSPSLLMNLTLASPPVNLLQLFTLFYLLWITTPLQGSLSCVLACTTYYVFIHRQDVHVRECAQLIIPFFLKTAPYATFLLFMLCQGC